MKAKIVLLIPLLAATVAVAQNSTAAPPATQPQSGAAPAAQTPAPTPHKVLQAKSKEELDAYNDARTKTDAAQAEAAANDFATKFPTSELRASLYMRVMNLYAQANNTDKVISVGREAIAADPTNPVPLVQVASALAESTRDTDLDKEQKLDEAAKDAQAALDNVDTGLLFPANADPAKIEGAKHGIRTMAYDTLGMVDMDRNDNAAAVTNLQKAIDESRGNPEAVLYLRLSVAQDKLKQYPQALDAANKAVQYAQPGTPAEGLAKQQQERLQKLISAGSPGGTSAPSAMPAPAPGQQATPSSMAPGSSTPH